MTNFIWKNTVFFETLDCIIFKFDDKLVEKAEIIPTSTSTSS